MRQDGDDRDKEERPGEEDRGFLEKRNEGEPGWLSWLSIRLMILVQLMISQFRG